MNFYQTSLIEEHSQLIGRVERLNDYVYNNDSCSDDRIEFANKCIQLAAMKKYEEALRVRMENAGIFFENGNYFERVASIGLSSITSEKCHITGKSCDCDCPSCTHKCEDDSKTESE